MTPEEKAIADKAEADKLAAEKAAVEQAELDKNLSAEEKEKKKIDAAVAVELAKIKAQLDASYAVRDAAVAKAAEVEDKLKKAEVDRLNAEGKTAEALKLQLADKDAELAILRSTNTTLSRDVEIRNALSKHTFRNDIASDMAFNTIASSLKLNENKQWVHTSGISIKDFVSTFAASDDNSFLFKAKVNNGTGDQENKQTQTDQKPKSLFAMSTAEVLKLAEEGKIGRP